jgi:hypothetical protein
MKNNDGLWKMLKSSLIGRFCKPWQEPAFVFYFLGIICIAGGLGFWLPIVIDASKGLENLPSNLATYFVALLTAGCADILLTTDPNSDFKINQRTFASFAVFALVLGIIVSMCSLFLNRNWGFAFFLSSSGTFASWIIWCIANADNTRLVGDNVAPTTPIGGKDINQVGGDIASYKS